MEIQKNKIRNIYYASSISAMIILSIVLSLIFIVSYDKESKLKIQQLSDGIYKMKKLILKEAIDRTLDEIDVEYDNVILEKEKSFNTMEKIIEEFISLENEETGLYKLLFPIIQRDKEFQFFFYDTVTKKSTNIDNFNKKTSILMNKDIFYDSLKKFKIYKIVSIDKKRMIVGFGVREKTIDSIVIERMKKRIRKTKLNDDGYIWINQIIDYNGGDDYAIRLVHPNMPETEGMKLSTKIEDIKGNKPYLEELEGVKSNSDIFYEYYFKKKNSEIIAHKLSYAKLYEKYNWIVATGLYLDDLDDLIASELQRMEKTKALVFKKTLIFGMICLLLLIIILIAFEKRIDKLISEFQKIVNSQKDKLEDDKRLLEEIAFIDPLTNIYNRRSIVQRLEEEMNYFKRQGNSFCVCMCDIDFFKKINDTYGHLAGDIVLQNCAVIFKDSLRKEDIVARWGGEEFLFFLTIPEVEVAYRKIENIRKIIENTEFECEDKKIKCTISFGLTIFNGDTDSYIKLIKRSDDALYEAKKTGRNKTVIYKLPRL